MVALFRLVIFSLLANPCFFEDSAMSAENIASSSLFLSKNISNLRSLNNNNETKNTIMKVSKNFHMDKSSQEIDQNISSNTPATINKEINQILDKIILNGLRKYRAATAIGLIMKVDTGEVISCSYIESQEISSETVVKKHDEITKLSNYLFQNGSVMKLMTIAKALDDHKITLSSKIDAKNEFHYNHYQIHDYFGKGRMLKLPEVFLYSSNIATARIARIAGWKREYDFYENILFEGSKHNGINYLAEVIKPEKKVELEAIFASIGHNVYATPLHYASAIASLVNGGRKISSTFKITIDKNRTNSIFMHSGTSEKLRKILEMNVVDGTAKRSGVEGYQTGGMTATAEKIINDEYKSKRVVSSFIGIIPVNEPKYLIMTVYDEPKPESFGEEYFTAGNNAAPTAADVIEEIAPLLGIKKKKI